MALKGARVQPSGKAVDRKTTATAAHTAVARVRAAGCFAGLTDEQVAEILQISDQRHFVAGQALLTYGASGDSLFILLEGRVRIVVPIDLPAVASALAQSRKILRELDAPPPVLVGEVNLLRSARRSATVEALTDVDAVEVARPALDRLAEVDPAAGYRLLRNISGVVADRLDVTNQDLRRLATALAWMATRQPHDTHDHRAGAALHKKSLLHKNSAVSRQLVAGLPWRAECLHKNSLGIGNLCAKPAGADPWSELARAMSSAARPGVADGAMVGPSATVLPEPPLVGLRGADQTALRGARRLAVVNSAITLLTAGGRPTEPQAVLALATQLEAWVLRGEPLAAGDADSAWPSTS